MLGPARRQRQANMNHSAGKRATESDQRVPFTRQEWLAEVRSAIAAAGLHWHVFGGWVEQTSPMCYAEIVTDSSPNETFRISLARDRFATPDQRRQEIVRQVALVRSGRE